VVTVVPQTLAARCTRLELERMRTGFLCSRTFGSVTTTHALLSLLAARVRALARRPRSSLVAFVGHHNEQIGRTVVLHMGALALWTPLSPGAWFHVKPPAHGASAVAERPVLQSEE
jgi:hypothetical protein